MTSLQPIPLHACLGGHELLTDDEITWDKGALHLRLRAYLCANLPPLPYVTSARCLVTRGDEILVVENPEEQYILPGGRLDPGETPEQAVRREVLEETGTVLGPLVQLGILHFHHLGPRPEGYGYPYPDFLQIVYTAEATSYRAEARVHDPYATGSYFLTRRDVLDLPLGPGQHALLRSVFDQPPGGQ